MAKIQKSYADGRGKLHNTPDAATISDLAQLFGSTEGMATGIAFKILENRSEIERILAEHDELLAEDRVVSLQPCRKA